jgi:hypothetical protein
MNSHPVRLVVTDDLRRSRLTVFFRILLTIPHFVVLVVWGVLAVIAIVLNWIATLVIGTPPSALWRFLARFLRYQLQVSAYLFLMANPFPPFLGGAYPVELELDGPAQQNRWVTGFRIPLALPAYILSSVLNYALEAAALLGWFASLALGRMPQGLRDLAALGLRYHAQTFAYFMVLTDRYPYSGPVAAEIPAPAPAPVPAQV